MQLRDRVSARTGGLSAALAVGAAVLAPAFVVSGFFVEGCGHDVARRDTTIGLGDVFGAGIGLVGKGLEIVGAASCVVSLALLGLAGVLAYRGRSRAA